MCVGIVLSKSAGRWGKCLRPLLWHVSQSDFRRLSVFNRFWQAGGANFCRTSKYAEISIHSNDSSQNWLRHGIGILNMFIGSIGILIRSVGILKRRYWCLLVLLVFWKSLLVFWTFSGQWWSSARTAPWAVTNRFLFASHQGFCPPPPNRYLENTCCVWFPWTGVQDDANLENMWTLVFNHLSKHCLQAFKQKWEW